MLGLGLSIPEVAIRGRRGFSPASLFSNGEQGVFFDPSDLTTLYQDSAGTTAVTAVEQPVGLMLDKSRQQIFEARRNLFVSSIFPNPTGSSWIDDSVTRTYAQADLDGGSTAILLNEGTASAAHQIRTSTGNLLTTPASTDFTVSFYVKDVDTRYVAVAVYGAFNFYRTVEFDLTAGIVNRNAGANVTLVSSSIAAISGGWYRCQVTYNTTDTTTKSVRIGFSDGATSLAVTNGNLPTITGTSRTFFLFGPQAEIASSASAYQPTSTYPVAWPGNHAYQTGATTLRPVLSARINQAIRSEDLSNAAWTTGNISNGTRVNGSVSLSSSEGWAYVRQSGTFSTTANQTISFDVTCDQTINSVPIRAGGITSVYQLVDLTAGQTVRVSLTNFGPVAAYFEIGIDARNAIVPGGSNATGYTVTFNRVDLRVANESATIPYQRVVTATDYDADPTKFPYYLRFDGSDDWLQTASIDFSAGPTNPPLGPELVANGTFESDATGTTPDTWQTNNANASFIKQADGTALFTSTSFAYVQLKSANYISVTAGKSYLVSFTVTDWVAGLSLLHVGISSSGNLVNGNGNYSYIYAASSTLSADFQIRPNGGGTGSFKIDNISVREIDSAYAPDKMSVFAGVRKLSDAARGTVVELTASADGNNGAFYLTAPNAASATYAFESKGTALTDAVASSSVAAPITSVLTGLGNIAGDSTILRVNGAQIDADTGDQGTGNYANAAMYIGRRGGSANPFNGRLHSLIVLGRTATADEIASAETWVNGKTGAY